MSRTAATKAAILFRLKADHFWWLRDCTPVLSAAAPIIEELLTTPIPRSLARHSRFRLVRVVTCTGRGSCNEPDSSQKVECRVGVSSFGSATVAEPLVPCLWDG